MIRVLQVLDGLNIGGAETMIMNIYRAIDRNQVQFDFIIHEVEPQYFENEAKSLGARIFRFPKPGKYRISYVKKYWNHFFESHAEYKILHSHVRSYASIYIPIAKKHGVKAIIHSHSTSNGSGFSSLIKSVLQYPLRYQADYLFACSEEAGKWLYGKRAIKKGNFYIIPNAIDAQKFVFNLDQRIKVRSELQLDNELVVGHCGRLVEPKNHKFLIEIFSIIHSKIPSSKLLLVGDGPLRKEIEKQIIDKGLENAVFLVGNKNNVFDYYQAMDVFVFPSLWEGLGMTAVEAQASGLHCIVSNMVPHAIDIGANLVCWKSLESSTTDWAESVISNSQKTRENQKNRLIASGYDIAASSKKILEFYCSL